MKSFLYKKKSKKYLLELSKHINNLSYYKIILRDYYDIFYIFKKKKYTEDKILFKFNEKLKLNSLLNLEEVKEKQIKKIEDVKHLRNRIDFVIDQFALIKQRFDMTEEVMRNNKKKYEEILNDIEIRFNKIDKIIKPSKKIRSKVKIIL